MRFPFKRQLWRNISVKRKKGNQDAKKEPRRGKKVQLLTLKMNIPLTRERVQMKKTRSTVLSLPPTQKKRQRLQNRTIGQKELVSVRRRKGRIKPWQQSAQILNYLWR